MNIFIKCNSCKKELTVVDVTALLTSEVVFHIQPCEDIDCYDCSKCEEVPDLENRVSSLNVKLINLREELKSSKKEEDDLQEEADYLRGEIEEKDIVIEDLNERLNRAG